MLSKSELTAKVAEKLGTSKKDGEAALDAVIESISETLAAGDGIRLIGFGSFDVKERAAREGVNPQKPSEKIKIPASKAVSFKAGATLKAAVNAPPPKKDKKSKK